MIGNIAIKEPTSFSYPVKSPSSSANFTQPANEENFADAMVKESSSNTQENNSVSKETTSASKSHWTLHYTMNGNEITLEWGEDILVAVGGIGGSVNVKYHESSTEEDPVVIAWGINSNGSAYKQLIHLNDVNPNHASPAEMLALKAHLAKSGKQDASNTDSGALWISLESFDVTQKTDFEEYYKEWIATQQLANNPSQAALYKLELERLLFYHHQNDNQNDKKEHFLSA